MKKLLRLPTAVLLCAAVSYHCTPAADVAPSDPTAGPRLTFRYRFDTEQERLDNLGQPAEIPAGNAAQTPDFQRLSVHVIDLAPDRFTPYGQGANAYRGAETSRSGAVAIDHDKALVAAAGEVFHTVDLRDLPPGTYEYARVSVSYQEYGLTYNLHDLPTLGSLEQQRGTVASYLGYNNYIGTVELHGESIDVNDAKRQGFYAFATDLDAPWNAYNTISSGDAPGTTVVNPIAASSPIPPGSCVVTGRFAEPLVITGNETADIDVTLSFSINQSFEWQDANGNDEWDLSADPNGANEAVVDMGLRGLVPRWE